MRLLLTLTSFAAMIGLAVPAHADDTDDAFLASLDAAGFTYSDPAKAISAANFVCKAAGGGTDMGDIAKAIQSKDSALSLDKATKFTTIAVNAYCPDAVSTTTADGGGSS